MCSLDGTDIGVNIKEGSKQYSNYLKEKNNLKRIIHCFIPKR